MEKNINEITHKIIGCAMQVHNTLGNGFQEVIYQRALAIEMRLAELLFEREMEMPIFYREERIGTRRVLHHFPFKDRKSTRLNSSHSAKPRMPSSA